MSGRPVAPRPRPPAPRASAGPSAPVEAEGVEGGGPAGAVTVEDRLLLEEPTPALAGGGEGRDTDGRPGPPVAVHLRRRPVRRPEGTSAHEVGPAPARGQQLASGVGATYRRVVPPGTARRFAARARQQRRALLKPLLVTLAVLVLVGGAAWALLASPLLVVRDVGVLGLDRLDPAAVAGVVDPSRDVPLARVDVGGLERQLEDLPLVESAVVARVWPSTLEVRVLERVPVAALPVPGGFDVVDRSAVTVMSTPEPPADVPVVQVDLATAGPGTVEAVTRVLDELPPDLREQVATAGGTSRDGVVLQLRSGAQVVWGSAADTALKAEVLAALLPRAAAVYDVSVPDWPVTRDA
ncbi:cell division protein FtsQ/DivIB [Pseudokineococcus sp. 1T1Z-3]|uniref:cell division protein FtsQ/DivIB n=1 Tax=Pseudokineococcus sp. 1T1Z-3 TaxID=3132745 RepID=UPI0030AE4B8F